MNVIIELAGVLNAFKNETIGCKVTLKVPFLEGLRQEIKIRENSPETRRWKNQIDLPPRFNKWVSGDIGYCTDNPDDYVLRCHDRQILTFLKREHALPVEAVKAIVFPRDEYLALSGVAKNIDECSRINNSTATHILMAIFTDIETHRQPLSPINFVKMLADDAPEGLTRVWYGDEFMTTDEVRAKAKESLEYWSRYCQVAD